MSSTDDRRLRRDRRSSAGACAPRSMPAGVPFDRGRTRRARSISSRSSSTPRVRSRGRRRPSRSRARVRGARSSSTAPGRSREVGEPVLVAALAAGAHYVDVGGDQAFLHDALRAPRLDGAARRARVVPGCGAQLRDRRSGRRRGPRRTCAASTTTAMSCARHRPARIGEAHPLDEVAVSYIFDDLVLSPGSQQAVFGNARHTRGLVWRAIAGSTSRPARRSGASTSGPSSVASAMRSRSRAATCITVPRHVAARTVQTYRVDDAQRRRERPRCGCSRARCRSCRSARAQLLAPYQPDRRRSTRARSFAVVAQARRGFSAAQVVVRGTRSVSNDRRRSLRGSRGSSSRAYAGPIGMRAPSELFRARAGAARARASRLAIEPSFVETQLSR